MKKAYFCTAEELEQRGKDNLPKQFQSGEHLIYSSPATLAFNSPGAEGFGVKRAGLAVPGSIMLIVAPGCCGRNTSMISSMKEYNNRFFYLCMDETDIVTGRHLKKIPKAVASICESLEKKPSVVMICITCVDALLGTDMERICRKSEEKTGLPVRPCCMYALTREGRKPPMVHVRQSLYSLLEPKKKKGNVVNLLGFFSPLMDDCELYGMLEKAGVTSFHVTLANHSDLENTIPPKNHPYFSEPGCFLKFCDEVRQYTNLPICGVGGLTDPDFVEKQLADGRIQCAAMSRQLLADPDWVNKLKDGHADQIHRCVRCNKKCLGGLMQHQGTHCIYEK